MSYFPWFLFAWAEISCKYSANQDQLLSLRAFAPFGSAATRIDTPAGADLVRDLRWFFAQWSLEPVAGGTSEKDDVVGVIFALGGHPL